MKKLLCSLIIFLIPLSTYAYSDEEVMEIMRKSTSICCEQAIIDYHWTIGKRSPELIYARQWSAFMEVMRRCMIRTAKGLLDKRERAKKK
jgi:hypothetical protein